MARIPVAQGWWKRLGCPLLRLYLGVRVVGRRNLPDRGGVIVAANHVSNLDPPVVGCQIRRPHATPAKRELFRNPVAGAILRQWGGLPVDRRRPGAEVIERMVAVLRGGDAIVIFPEGTRSRDGRLGRFQRGIGLLALAARVPVVPCFVAGTRRAMPPGAALPRPGRVTVCFGTPLWPDEFTGLVRADGRPASEREAQQAYADAVRRSVVRLARALGEPC
ncbi:MAG: 1-acyl-sn-glycerol-3-phosphate acyltransferase [Nitrospirae bacterium]|nr:MAG: 1-acyl-sn-glycerol-3-phosphate acyltransferase [Nitrospirota bacterium]